MPSRTIIRTQGGVSKNLTVNRDREAVVKTISRSGRDALPLDRTARGHDSDRVGQSRPLLSKVVGGASAAYSLRHLNDKQGNSKVVRVRRSGDNAERDFLAKEVSSTKLRDWVREPLQVLPARTPRLGQSNTNVSGFSTTWASDYRRVSVNKSAVTSGNKKVRIYDFQTDIDNTISSFPAKLKVEFNVSQIAGDDINTRTYTNRVNPVTNFGIYLSIKDDDVDLENPVYSNKRFFQIKRGFNSFEFELFDDGDSIKPSIDILLNGYSFGLELVISGISITNLTGADGFVTEWYDQSGNGRDATQPTIGSQPKIAVSGSLSADGIDFSSSKSINIPSNIGASSADFDLMSVFAVAKTNDTVTTQVGLTLDSIRFFLVPGVFGGFQFYKNSLMGNPSANTATNLFSVTAQRHESHNNRFINSAFLNGEFAGTNTLQGVNATFVNAGIGTFPAYFWNGSFQEVIIYTSSQAANRPAIEANIANQYGITLS